MAYATETSLKLYLGITVTTDDALLTNLLNAATAAIETYTHRCFAAITETRYFDEDDVDGDVLTLDDDLYSVTSIVNGEGNTVTAYWLLPRNAGPPYWQIKLKEGSAYDWDFDTDDEIDVTGRWGYSLTPPGDIEHACIRLAAYYYRQKDAQVFDVTAQPDQGILTIPQGIPKDVKVILDPYRKLGVF